MDERNFSYINKILAFYENEQSTDFENGILKRALQKTWCCSDWREPLRTKPAGICSIPDMLSEHAI